jgi:antitoxin component of MazEF toxin-antitoxin module
MPIVLKRKVVRIGNSLRVTLPPEICQILKIELGDDVEFSSSDGDIIIRKAKK